MLECTITKKRLCIALLHRIRTAVLLAAFSDNDRLALIRPEL